MLRSCRVAIVGVIGLRTILHLERCLMSAEAAAHARAMSIFTMPVSHFVALELQARFRADSSWEPHGRVSGLSNVIPLVLERARAHAHSSVPVEPQMARSQV